METPHSLAQSADDINTLASDVAEFYKQGKYAEALPFAERTLALAKQVWARDQPAISVSGNNLTLLHQEQARFSNAPRLRSSARLTDPEHPCVLISIRDLAMLLPTPSCDEACPCVGGEWTAVCARKIRQDTEREPHSDSIGMGGL